MNQLKKLTIKEIQIFSILLFVWGIILVVSGTVMSTKKKPEEKIEYTLKVSTQRIAQQQAKKNEIKLKTITVEINNPISLKVEDYLEEPEQISEETLKILKLDTSKVNLSEAGTYEYIINYNKKKYIGKVIVAKKELPDIDLVLKDIHLYIGESLPGTIEEYIETTITDDVKNNIEIDILDVNLNTPGDYPYYITYKKTKYEGKVYVREKGPTIITKITPKNKKIKVNSKLQDHPKYYIEEELSEDRYASIKLDTSEVKTNTPGVYKYKLIYKEKEYVGIITIYDPEKEESVQETENP